MRKRQCGLAVCLVMLTMTTFATSVKSTTTAEKQTQPEKNLPVVTEPSGPITPKVAQQVFAPPASQGPEAVSDHVKATDEEAPLTKKEKAANAQFVLKELNQSLGVPTTGVSLFNKRVQFGGLINIDPSYWSKPYFGQATHDQSGSGYLDLAELNLNGQINFGSWVNFQAGALYTNGKSPSVVNFRPSNRANRRVALEDAYFTVANFEKAPVYFQLGQMFVPFGRYERYPITQTLTQVLTQTDLPTVQAGIISQMGLVVAVYGVSGERKLNHSRSSGVNNYGASLGYENRQHPVGYDFGVDYLNNMADVDAIREIARDNSGYARSVPALSLHGDIYAGPFGFSARYVTALTRFNAQDYQETDRSSTHGAKPYAADFSADYKFETLNHHSRIALMYQLTGHANNTSSNISGSNVTKLPMYRWGTEYGVNLIKDLALSVQFYQDKNYTRRYGGNNKRDNVVTARLSFLF